MCSSPHWQVGSSWFRKKLSPANRNKGYRSEQISRKIVSRELNARSYRDFAKNIALLGATSAKFAKSVGKKMGSNMRPRYIQFRDIHDRDISGLHCIRKFEQSKGSKQWYSLEHGHISIKWSSIMYEFTKCQVNLVDVFYGNGQKMKVWRTDELTDMVIWMSSSNSSLHIKSLAPGIFKWNFK